MSSSVKTISLSKLSTTTHLSSARRFHPFRPVISAMKRFFKKIKSAPLFSRLKSEYIPYKEWELLHLRDELCEKFSSSEGYEGISSTVYDYEFASYRIRKVAKYLEQVEACATGSDGQDTLPSRKTEDDNFPEKPVRKGRKVNGPRIGFSDQEMLEYFQTVRVSELDREAWPHSAARPFSPDVGHVFLADSRESCGSRSGYRTDTHAYGRYDYDIYDYIYEHGSSSL